MDVQIEVKCYKSNNINTKDNNNIKDNITNNMNQNFQGQKDRLNSSGYIDTPYIPIL